MNDLKRAIGTGEKPDITHVRRAFKIYCARACEYGSAKYVRGNFLRMPEGATLKEQVENLLVYLGAADRHLSAITDALEAHRANDPEFEDREGVLAALFCADEDPDTSGKVGPSKLPHACGWAASVNMFLAKAVSLGLLPEDPGQPWAEKTAADDGLGCRHAVVRSEGAVDVCMICDHRWEKHACPSPSTGCKAGECDR